MFSNKEKTLNVDKNIDNKISHDFITHNMPAPHLFSGQTFANEEKKNSRAMVVSGPEKHQKIGLFIIAGGVILIGILFYFGYSYFVKPMISKTEKVTSKIDQTINNPMETSTALIEKTSPTEIIITDGPTIETSTTEFATSSEQGFTEETPVISTTINVSTVDSDADGLTDNEEKVIGTDPNKADSDNDGYLDLAELKSAYDPLVPSVKISDTSNVLLYKIDNKTATVYPASWEVSRNDDLDVVIFSEPDKAFIQVTYQDNPGKIQPTVWFNQQFSGVLPGEVISGDNWQGFYSQDGLAAYIFNQDFSKVYSFSCSPLTEDTDSIITFNLMIKSLVLK